MGHLLHARHCSKPRGYSHDQKQESLGPDVLLWFLPSALCCCISAAETVTWLLIIILGRFRVSSSVPALELRQTNGQPLLGPWLRSWPSSVGALDTSMGVSPAVQGQAQVRKSASQFAFALRSSALAVQVATKPFSDAHSPQVTSRVKQELPACLQTADRALP